VPWVNQRNRHTASGGALESFGGSGSFLVHVGAPGYHPGSIAAGAASFSLQGFPYEEGQLFDQV